MQMKVRSKKKHLKMKHLNEEPVERGIIVINGPVSIHTHPLICIHSFTSTISCFVHIIDEETEYETGPIRYTLIIMISDKPMVVFISKTSYMSFHV